MVCKQSYRNQREQGLITPTAMQYLRGLSDAAMDETCELNEWSQIERMLRASRQLSAHTGGAKKWGQMSDVAKLAQGKGQGKGQPKMLQRPPSAGDRRSSFAQRGSLRQMMGIGSMGDLAGGLVGVLTGAPKGREWRSLSKKEKVEYAFKSLTWTIIVCTLVILCTTLTLTNGASSLASIFDPSTLTPTGYTAGTYQLTTMQSRLQTSLPP